VSDAQAPLASCNVCGESSFQPGPFKRLSMTGRLPCCVGCGSLERHRIARRVMDLLPDSLIAGKRVLQFSMDSSVNKARVSEHRVSEYGASDSLDMQAIAVEDGRYDWIVSHHVVNSVENDVKGLREMLRVVGPKGAVLISVGGTCDRFDTQIFSEATGPYLAFKHYGGDFVERFYDHVPNASALELVATDPCTATLDVIFIYSREIELLREIGRVMAPRNIYARLTTARDLAHKAASVSAVSAAPAGAESPRPSSTSKANVPQGAPDDPRWQPLVAELAEWRRVGRSPRFWLRDDDASREHPNLEALWQLCATNRITLACAAIPKSIEPSLIDWAKGKSWLVMLQHGFDHVNRAAADASSSSEFPDSRELSDALQALRTGKELMASFGSVHLPILVPPWGHIAERVTTRLGELGFSGISGSYLRRAPRENGIAVTNTHVLVPRRTPEGWGFEIEPVVSQLVAALAAVRARPEGDRFEPIGVNTHHLNVGETELLALGSLVHITRSCGAEWLHPSDLFQKAW